MTWLRTHPSAPTPAPRRGLKCKFTCCLAMLWAISCAGSCVGQHSSSRLPFIAAATPGRFQDAMRAGVEHILLMEHLDMTRSPTEPDMDEQAEALDTAIGRLQETTKSIGVRAVAMANDMRRCVACSFFCSNLQIYID